MTSLKNLLCAFALVTSVGTAHVVSAEERFPQVYSGRGTVYPLAQRFDAICKEWQMNECNVCAPEYGSNRLAMLHEASSLYRYTNELIGDAEQTKAAAKNVAGCVGDTMGTLGALALCSVLFNKLGGVALLRSALGKNPDVVFDNRWEYGLLYASLSATLVAYVSSLEAGRYTNLEQLVTLRDSIKRFVEAQGVMLD